jgi:hypothetical protein
VPPALRGRQCGPPLRGVARPPYGVPHRGLVGDVVVDDRLAGDRVDDAQPAGLLNDERHGPNLLTFDIR